MITNFSTLFYEDSYRQDFCAELLEIAEPTQSGEPYRLRLSQTCFYPEGGGQPGDRGLLAASAQGLEQPEQSVPVLDTREEAGEVWLLCPAPLPFQLGQTLYGRIDWARRFDFMQQHSAEHILSGLICARYGCHNVGFHINEREMTLDFDVFIDLKALAELELEANRAIQRNLPIKISTHEPEEIKSLDFRAKKAIPERLRLVSIEGVDCCACCGTQLRHSGEIGALVIRSAMRYKGGVRLSALAGLRALRYVQQRFRASSAAAEALSCPAVEIDQSVAKLLDKQREQEQFSARLSRLLFTNSLPDATRLKMPDSCRYFSGFNDPQIKAYCKQMAENFSGVHYALSDSGEGSGLRYFAASRDCDLRALGPKLAAALGARGGGQSGFIQGQIPLSWTEAQLYFAKICSLLPEMVL